MRTTDEIYAALSADFVSAGGAIPVEGGDMWLRLRSVAAEISALEAQSDFVARQCFPQTASGTYLDSHAALRGLGRGEALHAVGTLRFYRENAAEDTLKIPMGTECMTAAGASFVTTQAEAIPAGDTWRDVPARATLAGSTGNVPVGAVAYMKLAPAGVQGVTNPTAFSGGTDGEEDESLRARVLASYRTLPNGANIGYYESKVLDFDYAEAVTVIPKKRGLGTVDVVFASHAGVPTKDQLSEVEAVLKSEREICVDIAVSAPVTARVDVTAALTIADGYDFAAVKAAADAAISGYFSGARLSRGVPRAGLYALLMAVDGVENVSIAEPASDLPALSGTLPVAGTVTISEA